MTDWFGAKPILDRSHGRRGAWNTHPQPCPEQRGHLAHHDTLHSSKHQLHKGPDTLVRPVEIQSSLGRNWPFFPLLEPIRHQ
jgi:hypothetical protein